MARIVMLVNTYHVKAVGSKALLDQRICVEEMPYWEVELNSERANPQATIYDIVRSTKDTAENRFRKNCVKGGAIKAEVMQFQIIP